jgi:hypothetical protein
LTNLASDGSIQKLALLIEVKNLVSAVGHAIIAPIFILLSLEGIVENA